MKIAPVDEGHFYGYALQTLGCVKPAEASTNDDDPMGRCYSSHAHSIATTERALLRSYVLRGMLKQTNRGKFPSPSGTIDRARKLVVLRRQAHCRKIWKCFLGRLIQQALLCALLDDAPNVIRVEFQHFTDVIEAKEPIVILVQDPLGRLGEDSFSASTFCRTVLEVTIDCVLKHRRDQFYLRRMSGTTSIHMEILMDDDDVGLSEQISCLFPTEEIFCDLFMHKRLFV